MRSSVATHIAGKPRAIALMGPTASGKTELAIALHQQVGAEIISVDSALVYRGMNIGSAKPCADELAKAPHRLIDIRDPSEPYSTAEFAADARREMEVIVASGKIPLLVGGTMLYFKTLLEGLADMPAADPAVRAQLDAEAQKYGWPYLHQQLQAVDPETAANLHPNHSQRISRALEVYRISGKPISECRQKNIGGLLDDYDWVQIAIAPRDRSILHQRISDRFEKMLELGLVDEVKALFDCPGLNADLPAIKAVGYRQVWDFLAGENSYEQMIDKGKAATRQLAKRQLTWLRSWAKVNWLYTQNETGKSLTSHEIVIKALRILDQTTI